jgi:predicted MPP superfamily phosphohydrolase
VKPERRPYSKGYHYVEELLRALYLRNWPAHLWARWPGSTRVDLIEHDLTLPGRDRSRPPLRVAFASDLHLGPTTPAALLDHAFALLRAARPDVLALGGDYVFLGATTSRVTELKRRVAGVEAATKVAVLGNHDFWARPERLDEALREVGVHVLVNRAVRLPSPHDDVAVVGLDDPLTGRAAVAHALEPVADAAVKIAICHSPDGVKAAQGTGISLFLCGHTHGGHICLPGYRPLIMPSRAGRRWPYGLHQVDGLTLFVSRGVGGSILPVRTWAPPDVAVLTLR